MNDTLDDHKKAFERVLKEGGFHEMKVQTFLETAELTERQRKIIDRAVVTGAVLQPDNLAPYLKQYKAGEPVAKDDEEAQMLADVVKAELHFLENEYTDLLGTMGRPFRAQTIEQAARNKLLREARERIARREGEAKHRRDRNRGLRKGSIANQQSTDDRNKSEFKRLVDRAEKHIQRTGSDLSFLDDGRTAWPIIDPGKHWRSSFGRRGGPRHPRTLTEDLRLVKAVLLKRNTPSSIAG